MFRNVGKLAPKLAQLSSQQIVLKNNYYRVLTTKTIRNPLTVQSHFTQRRYKETDYSNFGNEPDKPTKYGIFYRLLLAIVPWVLFMSPVGTWIGEIGKVDAESVKENGDHAIDSKEQTKGEEEQELKKKKKRVGFRDRKIIEYENRIREYSTPDKIFRYFATLKGVHDNGEWEVFMTPEDFVRSITPGMKQPEGLGLDQFKKFNMKADEIKTNLSSDSIFYKLAENGLISFSDYIFLLVILSTPSRLFDIGFKMFDINGDGSVEYAEFEKMQSIAMKQSSMGIKHRDHSTTGSTLKPTTNSAVTIYFFGKHLNKSMTVDRFHEFQEQLNREILLLEFNRYDPTDGKITERDFASSLLTFAGFKDTKGKKMLKRVKKAFSDDNAQGISFKEYMDFYRVMLFINDIDTALTFYNIAGASIDKDTLKHIAKTVADVNLSDHLVDVVFAVFDENEDGQLSNKEFISVMKRRMSRGLEKPKDTGFTRLLSAAWQCTISQISPFS